MSDDRFKRQEELVPRDNMPDMVTVIGVGSIGRNVALQLAAIGTPHIQLIDFDTVESHNITTQGFHWIDVGNLKVTCTLRNINMIDSKVVVDTIADRWRPNVKTGDAVFCCVDSIETRTLIWKHMKSHARFFVDGRMMGETMRILAVDVDHRDYYETTLFKTEEAVPGRCTSRSTIYAASMAASWMVHQFTRFLRRIPVDRDMLVNLLAGEVVHQ